MDIAEAEQPGQAKPGTVEGRFYIYPFLYLSLFICILFIFFLYYLHFFHILPFFTCSGSGMYGGNLDLVSRRENVQVILEESWSHNTTAHSYNDIAQVIMA